MKLDDTLISILEEIQIKVADKKDIELSIEEIHNIVDFQLQSTVMGISKGFDVSWSRVGKFIFTDKKARRTERNLTFAEIESLKRMNPNYDAEKAKHDFALKKIEDTKKNKLDKKRASITAKDLINANTISTPNNIIFKSLSKR